MLSLIRQCLNALKDWRCDIANVYTSLQHSQYRVQCPAGHAYTLPRQLVERMSHTESGMARIDYGFEPESSAIPISYLDCPHQDCQSLAKRHSVAQNLYAS